MGCYIEPNNESKPEFLERVGKETTFDYVIKNIQQLTKEKSYLPVVLMRPVTAGILYSVSEFKRLLRDTGDECLTYKYYLVSISDLISVSNIEKFIEL